MYYDDYFDSFSITSTSKAPEYPLWILRCFYSRNIELFSPHRLAFYSTVPDSNSLLYL